MKLKPDRRNYRLILNEPGVVEAAKRKAEEIASIARATAPHDSGAYAASIEVGTEKGGIKNDRTVATVTATVPYAAAIEFGNSRSPARHTLRRAADGV